MRSPFRHTALPQTTTPWLAAQATTWQMIGCCLCPFRWQTMPISLRVWVRSFIEPDLFDHNVPFDNTTPIYLINLPLKLGLGGRLHLKLHVFFREFHGGNLFNLYNCCNYYYFGWYEQQETSQRQGYEFKRDRESNAAQRPQTNKANKRLRGGWWTYDDITVYCAGDQDDSWWEVFQ